MHPSIGVGIVLAMATVIPACRPRAALPRTMIWAWERDEDLRGAPPDVGVAYLAATIFVESDRLRVVPRQHALHVDDATPRLAVVRLELPGDGVDDALRARLATAIVGFASPRGVQLDFESRLSQRELHAQLLRDLRRRLPDGAWLSTTALASWCLGD